MGTRHLIVVIKDGVNKVAQYGQWDGYPDGQGADVLDFISSKTKLDDLGRSLDKVRFLDGEGRDKDFIDLYNSRAPQWSNEEDKRSDEQKRWWEMFCHRDLGSKILENLALSDDSEIILRDSFDFGMDSLMCEWAYVIDLDKKLFVVFDGFSEADSFGLWAGKIGCISDGYGPIKQVKSYSLLNLPSRDDFISDFAEDED